MMPYFAAFSCSHNNYDAKLHLNHNHSGRQCTKIDMAKITEMFVTAVIFHSYMIGMVAGKISARRMVAAGFKHAAAL